MRIKAQHPDVLLFYRMGDFFEMFYRFASGISPTLEADGVASGASDLSVDNLMSTLSTLQWPYVEKNDIFRHILRTTD